jgi:hypothetical protein
LGGCLWRSLLLLRLLRLHEPLLRLLRDPRQLQLRPLLLLLLLLLLRLLLLCKRLLQLFPRGPLDFDSKLRGRPGTDGLLVNGIVQLSKRQSCPDGARDGGLGWDNRKAACSRTGRA